MQYPQSPILDRIYHRDNRLVYADSSRSLEHGMAFLSKFAKNVILLVGMIVVTLLCVFSIPFTTRILNYSLGYDNLSVEVTTDRKSVV